MAAAASARAKPVFPLEGLLRKRTGSKNSRVGPADTRHRIGLVIIEKRTRLRLLREYVPPDLIIMKLNTGQGDKPAEKRPDNPWLNIGCNILLPAMLLVKASRWFGLSPAEALVLALTFPLCYGLFDFFVSKKFNFISALGFAGILLTGGIGLLRLDKEWIAIKEAAVPSIIGIAILISLKTPYPLVRSFLYNDRTIDVPLVEARLAERGTRCAFDRLLVFCTLLLGSSFLLSAILNYSLARYIIRSETGTEAFNVELGRMTILSWPVIVIPCMFITVYALWKLLHGIQGLTGLKVEKIFRTPEHQNTQNSVSK